MLNYMVVYPKGDRTRLSVAQVLDYEQSDWALASMQKFGYDKQACREYMIELAEKHNLDYDGKQHLLD